MAIPKFLRSVFGAPDTPGDVDFDDMEHPAAETAAPTTPPPARTDIPVELLDAIAAVINAQLPPFVSQCVDIEAERNFLAAELGEALADYAETLNARQREFSGKREAQKAALLSEQRKRRALTDRNHDLEAQIDELSAEIDQHKLTISSMMNKIRVAEVNDADSSALRDDYEALTSELSMKNAEIAKLRDSVEELTQKLADAEAAKAEAAKSDAPKRKRGPRKPRVHTYDPANDSSANLDNVDWLLPGGVPAGHTPIASDPDFGYQPPKQAPVPDSDAQLTLF